MAKRKLNRRQLARLREVQARRRDRAEAVSPARPDGARPGPESARPGLVTASYGATVVVEADDDGLYSCTLRRNLEHAPAVCGDRVVWQPVADGDAAGVVTAIRERRSLLQKPDSSGRLKAVAANVDQAAIVLAPRPAPSPSLIDRYLVVLEAAGVGALLVLNKIDLLAGGEDALDPALGAALDDYTRLGYPVLRVSSRGGQGLEGLRDRLRDRVSVLLGQSGVGKSSLTRSLLPGREIRVQALSRTTGLGTHTTTTAMLYRLPGGGCLIDSPGVRSFEPDAVDDGQLEQGFVEFRPYLGRCRFSDCRHGEEPDCALRKAVAAGAIAARRLDSYLQIRAAARRRTP